MSRLMYRSYYPSVPDAFVAEFPGTALETLGLALADFNNKAYERAKRLTSGEIPAVPDVIAERASQMLSMKLPERSCHFTVIQTESGFNIWPSEGPDQYYLMD